MTSGRSAPARQRILEWFERVTNGPRGRDQVALFWGRPRRPGDRLLASAYYTLAAKGWATRATNATHVKPLLEGLERCPEPRRVLDLGTGAGAGAAVIARRFPRAEVWGVDHNRRMLRIARRVNGEPNLRFQRARSLRLPFEDGYFDLACLLNAAPELGELRRVLTSDGHVLIGNSFQDSSLEAWITRWRLAGFECVATEACGRGHWELFRPTEDGPPER